MILVVRAVKHGFVGMFGLDTKDGSERKLAMMVHAHGNPGNWTREAGLPEFGKQPCTAGESAGPGLHETLQWDPSPHWLLLSLILNPDPKTPPGYLPHLLKNNIRR